MLFASMAHSSLPSLDHRFDGSFPSGRRTGYPGKIGVLPHLMGLLFAIFIVRIGGHDNLVSNDYYHYYEDYKDEGSTDEGPSYGNIRCSSPACLIGSRLHVCDYPGCRFYICTGCNIIDPDTR